MSTLRFLSYVVLMGAFCQGVYASPTQQSGSSSAGHWSFSTGPLLGKVDDTGIDHANVEIDSGDATTIKFLDNSLDLGFLAEAIYRSPNTPYFTKISYRFLRPRKTLAINTTDEVSLNILQSSALESLYGDGIDVIYKRKVIFGELQGLFARDFKYHCFELRPYGGVSFFHFYRDIGINDLYSEEFEMPPNELIDVSIRQSAYGLGPEIGLMMLTHVNRIVSLILDMHTALHLGFLDAHLDGEDADDVSHIALSRPNAVPTLFGKVALQLQFPSFHQYHGSSFIRLGVQGTKYYNFITMHSLSDFGALENSDTARADLNVFSVFVAIGVKG